VVHNLPFLLTDTVGFIRKLPHQLVESFKSTLDEVREADLLVHVLDISHESFEEHYQVVNQTLAELDDSEKPHILVFNKIDVYKPEVSIDENGEEVEESMEDLKKTWMAKLNQKNVVFISAQNKENMEEFKEMVYQEVKEIFRVRYPYNNFLY
jgi:GTP-binding protein HflX